MNGHECVAFCEIDKYARQSYKAIYDTEGELEVHDITKWTDEHIRQFVRDRGHIDCITGGFPCQSFSIAGKRGGFADTRGTLFFEIMRIADIVRPRYLFLENVKGLLSHDGGATFETILNTLDEFGYDAEWQVLNSKNFGVPQNRERVFIIGHLRGAGGRAVFPVGGEYTTNISDTVKGADFRYDEGLRIRKNGTSPALKANNQKMGTDNTDLSNSIYAVLTPDRINKRQNGRRFKEDGEPMFTLTAQDRHGITDGIRIRKLTPKETWRLQGFTDEQFYKAKNSGVSDSQLYKQAGNSVTVNVIDAIVRKFS